MKLELLLSRQQLILDTSIPLIRVRVYRRRCLENRDLFSDSRNLSERERERESSSGQAWRSDDGRGFLFVAWLDDERARSSTGRDSEGVSRQSFALSS